MLERKPQRFTVSVVYPDGAPGHGKDRVELTLGLDLVHIGNDFHGEGDLPFDPRGVRCDIKIGEGSVVAMRCYFGEHRRYTLTVEYPKRQDHPSTRNCKHSSTKSGPRMPLRYGSAATDVCEACGAYRLMHHGPGPWESGPVEEAVAQAEKDKEDEL